MASGSDDDVNPHLGLKAHWHETFEQIFQDFSQDEWRLEPTKNAKPQEWGKFTDAAKVKFVCKQCDNSWTSMRGVVIFWFKKIGEGERRVVQREDEGSEDARETITIGNVCRWICKKLFFSPQFVKALSLLSRFLLFCSSRKEKKLSQTGCHCYKTELHQKRLEFPELNFLEI